MTHRRQFLQLCSCAAGLLAATAASAASGSAAARGPAPRTATTHPTRLSAIARSHHEAAMREAILEGRRNPQYPFGAVITDIESGEILARGVNDAGANPTLHGEIACLNHYVQAHGNRDWDRRILYSTAEPCPMCMSALAWAGVGGVVWGSSIATLQAADIPQIAIGAEQVAAAAGFYQGELLGGMLATETDPLFLGRPRAKT